MLLTTARDADSVSEGRRYSLTAVMLLLARPGVQLITAMLMLAASSPCSA